MSSEGFNRDRVAIVGIGLSFPGGAVDPDSFWQLLQKKIDATVDIPEDRWDWRRFYSPYGSEKPGKMYVRRGGFLQGDIRAFDPLYFGISPREAPVIDVQQRLLLEVAAKALQDAGMPEERFQGSRMGVFVGGFCMDASIEAASIHNRNWYVSQSVTGSTATLLSNRLSYVFDLKGPSLTVDTACSSSLVALHLAVQSLLAGECEAALVGGVNAMTQPEHFLEMCKGRLLSKDGRCFTWDERANGYARGEGAGMVLLKRLSQAQRDGDHIYAVVEATGVNQDGTTQGISLPNPKAQAALIRSVLDKAGLTPAHIDYVEAHGTGTQAGDKAETSALNEVFAPGRQDKLRIGSVKTNIGHLEAAAGMSGLIKTVLSLSRGRIPANLHFETPNPAIPFDSLCLQVATDMQAWPQRGDTRYAGVNSFGYGGTNAHAILSQAPAAGSAPDATHGAAHGAAPGGEEAGQGPLLLPLSAHSQDALRALASQYAELLAQDKVGVRPLLRHVSTRRTHYERRGLVWARDKQELIARLRQVAEGAATEGFSQVAQPSGAQPLVFVYSGMGPQWWGMGQELLASNALFAETLREVDRVFRGIAGWSLLEEMTRPEASSRMARTEVAQPANFAIQVGLTALWRSWGIEPAAVVGHSVGEVTAAYVSGILSLEDALLVSYHRSRLQGTLAHTGGMLAVGLSEAAVQDYLREHEGKVSVAAVNSPRAVTLAGHTPSLQALAETLQQAGVFHRVLQVEVPYHSPLMDPIEHEIQDCLRQIQPRPAAIPCYSTVTARQAGPGDFGARYWWHNVRETVSFARTVEALADDGLRSFLEVGPHPVLGNSVREILQERKLSGQVHSSLRRQMPEQATLIESLGTLYSQGHRLDWEALQPQADGPRVVLPVYPWQRQHYDNGSPRFHQDKFGSRGHPILKRDLELPRPAWEVELGDALFPYLVDHRIDDKTVVPGAFYVEAALALMAQRTGARTGSLQGLAFERFLALADEMEAQETRIVSSFSEEAQDFRIHSTRTALKESWECHARGEFAALAPLNRELDMLDQDLDSFRSHDVDAFYRRIAGTGLQYGPSFRPIRCLKSLGDKVYAELDNTLAHEPAYILPPTVLDSVFQTLLLFGGSQSVPFVPVRIERLSVHGPVTARNKVLGRLSWRSARSLKADFMVFDEQDTPIVEILGVTCQALPSFGPGGARVDEALYRSTWLPCEPELLAQARPASGGVLLVTDAADGGAQLAALIARYMPVLTLPAADWSEQAFAELLRSQQIGVVAYHAQAASTEAQALEDSITHCVRLGQIAQGIERELAQGGSAPGSRLVLLTHSACRVQPGDRVEGLAQLALPGLLRTLNTEFRQLRCASIDLGGADAGALEGQLRLAIDALIAQDPGVQELAVRGERLYRHVLQSCASEASQEAVQDSAPGEGVQVQDLAAALGSPLAFSRQPRVLLAACPQAPGQRVLGDDEVEIEVEQHLLNAFDLHNSQLSVLPDDPARHHFRYQPGMQCVGTVVKKGAAVNRLALGERVLSLQANGLGNYAVVPAQGLLRLPEALDPSALPDMYECLRAHYLMKTLGTPARGGQLVVKGRWGAFVQTVLHEAQQRGYATSFVDEESLPLAREGLARHAGARYLAAEDGHWKEQLDGLIAGVDVFVNHGWQDIDQLPRLLPFARVLDCRSAQLPRKGGLSLPLRANASYQAIEVDELFRDHFPTLEACLRELLQALADGRLPLAPVPAHPWRDVAAALRELKTPGHAAVRLVAVQSPVPVARQTRPADQAWDGCYLVTGGTRGFGLQCARWLVQQGARHLVLISRSGVGSAEAGQAIEAMREQGATVQVCALDIADAAALQAALDEVLAGMPPVRGVMHAAMVLDDGFVSQMNAARYRKVMRPKMQGALNLAAALGQAELRFFLMFSSISSLIGNAGQANYVAANSFLDGYAGHLSARGVPARTINWGVLSDSGVLAQDAELTRMLALAGIQGVGNELAMQALERVLGEAHAQVGVFRMDWTQWQAANPSQSASGLYSEVLDPSGQSDEEDPLQQLLLAVIDAGPEQRRQYVQAQLSARFGQIFKMDPGQINVHASIIELGVDSLIAAEITMALRAELGVEIALIDMLSGPSIVSLSERILAQIEALIEEAAAHESAPIAPEAPGQALVQEPPARSLA